MRGSSNQFGGKWAQKKKKKPNRGSPIRGRLNRKYYYFLNYFFFFFSRQDELCCFPCKHIFQPAQPANCLSNFLLLLLFNLALNSSQNIRRFIPPPTHFAIANIEPSPANAPVRALLHRRTRNTKTASTPVTAGETQQQHSQPRVTRGRTKNYSNTGGRKKSR